MTIISYTLHKLGCICKRWSPSWLWRISSATTTEKQVIEKSKAAQGCALRKIEGSPVLGTCKIQGAQHMICMKNLRFSSRPRAKVWRKGPTGSAKAQPCFLQYMNCKWIQKWICNPQILGETPVLTTSTIWYVNFGSLVLNSLAVLLDILCLLTCHRKFLIYYTYNN